MAQFSNGDTKIPNNIVENNRNNKKIRGNVPIFGEFRGFLPVKITTESLNMKKRKMIEEIIPEAKSQK